MYLKKVEVCGFKSFADKIKLEFEQGITGIIGPNGCGKSNVADAIRWCLGEQSAHSLRSKQMMDVIFNGSQSRATTGMAEVSITFDNSQNVLPIDFSEVTVTRRLFRSGESEYFINKSQCRLKDVKDLFLDTGIGTEGYSIMEQGKVEFILSAKPEERRELFEEAAGVSRYKARREEALRKLQKVEIDMNRINDMLALLKEQITSLDTAARKARQYKKHQEDLKRLEISHLVHNIHDNMEEIEKINTSLNPKNLEFEALNTQLDQYETEISEIRVLQTEKDDAYIKLQDELSHIKSDINVSDERIQQAGHREIELNERQIIIQNDVALTTERTERQKNDLFTVTELCKNIAAQVEKLEIEYKEKETELNTIREEIAKAQNEESDVKNRLFAIAAEKTNIHNEQNKLQSYLAHAQAQILSLQKDLTRLNEQLAPVQGEASKKHQEIAELKNKKSNMSQQLLAVSDEIHAIENQQFEMREKIRSLKDQTVSLESKKQTILEWEKQDPRRAPIRSVLNLDLHGIKGPVSSLIRIAAGSEEIVAAALGEKLNYLLSDTIESAQKAIAFLDENNLGRVTFIISERLTDKTAAPITEIVGARSLDSLMQYDPSLQKEIHFICAEALVQGRTVYGNALLQGGSQSTPDKSVMVDEQLRKIDEELSFINKEMSEKQALEESLRQQLHALQPKQAELSFEQQKVDIQLELQEEQMSNQLQEVELLEKDVLLTNEDLRKHNEEEKRTQESLKTLAEQLLVLDAEDKSLKDRQLQLHARIQDIRNVEERTAPILTESKVAWATQLNELSSRKREEETLNESILALNQRIASFHDEFETNKTKIIEQKQIQTTETDRLKEFYAQQETKEKEVRKSLAERQELLNSLNEKTKYLHELRHTTELLKHEIHKLQLDQRSVELRQQNFISRLKDDYDTSYEEAREEYLTIPVQEEEIARLKRRIESIGPVNLAAPEEYANLEERYNFLLSQQQDLVKAKEDLHQVITKINNTTKENFKQTFYQVQEYFRNIYGQLFEGGEADLVLTDESNLLESGVDIIAQPPGKKFQNIALLSGGEKALTAIALLFAFFMVRPSPFCVLDEVDAPLDDANVGRFINMVKSFSSKSQFLIITHSKRTMEMANILYGVTMEELGVSKVISVRLQKEVLAVTA